MATFKELGTKAFTAKDYSTAIEHFTAAIQESSHDHTLYSNRSACYFNIYKPALALADADKCIEIKSDWDKGHQRRAMALQQMGRFDESIASYEQGLQLNAENAQIKQGLEQARKEKAAAESKPEDGGNEMFGPAAQAKLMANPQIAQYFKDPQFQTKFSMCEKDPQMMMQFVQSDPRMMHVFKEMTGIDLMEMQSQQMKQKDKSEDIRKKREEEDKKRKEEEEKRKKQEAEDALPEEDKIRIQRKKEAVAEKEKGNEFYKKKQFEDAIRHYEKAIELDPNEVTYLNNKAAVYFEQKNFEKCIETCDQAIELSKGANYDYVKLGKAIGRKGNCKLAQGLFDEAIELYKSSLLENNDANIKDQLKKAERLRKEDEDQKMIDPEKAEELRKKGNELFEKGDFPGAVKVYTEGLQRDPNSKAIYSNRSAAYIKLLEFVYAMKDAEKCLSMDPKFVKAWLRKATCHHFMKEYHKAIDAFDKGLLLDPENKDLKEGKMRTMATIQSSAYASSGEHDQERLRHASADPEIQALMRDPRIIQVLKEMQENPMAAQGALRDPFINTAINKLIAAGIIKMA